MVDEENGVTLAENQTGDLEYLVEGLQPFHVYAISLASSTVIGLGPYTPPALIEMPEDGTEN